MKELSPLEAAKLLIERKERGEEQPSLWFWDENSRQLSARGLTGVDLWAEGDCPAFYTDEGEFFFHCALPDSSNNKDRRTGNDYE